MESGSENRTPAPSAAEAAPPSAPRARGSLAAVWTVGVPLLALAVMAGFWYQTRQELAKMRATEQQILDEVNAAHGAPTIDITGAPVEGSPDAVVTLIEFADYECPFCIRHFTQTMPQIEANYIKTGKVRYVFRDLPIDQLHPTAIRAHEAARCAAEQGRFWELHPLLFSPPGTHSDAAIEALARKAGLDMPTFTACLESGRTTAAVRQTAAAAAQLGATGTPTFFIGLRDGSSDQIRVVQGIAGAQPYAAFARALDAAAARVAN